MQHLSTSTAASLIFGIAGIVAAFWLFIFRRSIRDRILSKWQNKHVNLFYYSLILCAALGGAYSIHLWSENAFDSESPGNLTEMAVEAMKQGHYREAESYMERAVKTYRRQTDTDLRTDAFYAIQLNVLSMVYSENNKMDDAVRLCKQSLEIRERVLKPGAHDIGQSLNNLAHLYIERGEYHDAEPLAKRALAINRKEHPGDPDISKYLGTLGEVYLGEKKYGEAKPLFQEALDLCKNNLQPNDPLIATQLENLGTVYLRTESYNQAEPFLKEALAIRTNSLSSNHPRVALSAFLLAWTDEHRGNTMEAKALYRQALKVWESNDSEPKNQNYFDSVERLTLLSKKDGELGEAESLLKSEIRLLERRQGKADQKLLDCWANLASVYQAEGKQIEAEQMHKKLTENATQQLPREEHHIW